MKVLAERDLHHLTGAVLLDDGHHTRLAHGDAFRGLDVALNVVVVSLGNLLGHEDLDVLANGFGLGVAKQLE